MAKIIYGVAGEGMGHATRSKVVISHLLKKKHDIHIVSSDRAFDFLDKSFPNLSKTKISGLKLEYEDNQVKVLKSITTNLRLREGKDSYLKIRRLIKQIKPALIITDYEPTVAYLSGVKLFLKRKKIPLISIDNNHISANCKVKIPKKHLHDYLILKYLNDLLVPPLNVNQYLITTFFHPTIKRKKTQLIKPLIREDVLKAKPSSNGHILIYQTSKTNTAMFKELQTFKKEKFLVYGFNVSKKEGNLHYKRFSETQFINDLASCKAVICNGGFSLISEAVYLKKPVLSIPVKRQFEQILNAIYIQEEGYGEFYESFNRKGFLQFLNNLDKYRRNLEKHKQTGNQEAFKLIDETIKNVLTEK